MNLLVIESLKVTSTANSIRCDVSALLQKIIDLIVISKDDVLKVLELKSFWDGSAGG